MFEHFSFATTTSRRCYHMSSESMVDSISPCSSRDSSPVHLDSYSASERGATMAATSIAELSQHFGQHSLSQQRLGLEENGLLSSPNEHGCDHCTSSNPSRRQRQYASPLQHNSPHLSRISAVVQDMVQSTQPIYDSIHPLSMLEDSTSPSLSPDDEAPSAESYFGFTSLRSSAFTARRFQDPARQSSRFPRSYKIDKDLRHTASRGGGIGTGQRMVQKKIRMRRRAKTLPKETGRKKDE